MPALPDLSIQDDLRRSLQAKPFLKLTNPIGFSPLISNERITDPIPDDYTSERNFLEKSPLFDDDEPLSDLIKEKRSGPSPSSTLGRHTFPKARAVKPKLVFRQTLPRHIPPSVVISPPTLKPHFTRKHRSAQTSLSTVLHPSNASVYASHFPPGHLLDANFVSKYAPGAEVGSGAYGFVITAVDAASHNVVAVKFIEKRKIPTWGWYDDPDLGNIPLEVALLRMLDHPGVIKFIELFQDSTYFYFVQELHGSPWCGRQDRKITKYPSKMTVINTKDLAVFPEHDSTTATIVTDSSTYLDLFNDAVMVDIPQTRPAPLSSSSSDTNSSSSANSEPRPLKSRKLRKLSFDLFECIEQHQHFSESQARHIFRQIVDVVHYLDRMGIYHRDIKDENVLIDNNYRVKLVDFGSAVKVEPRDLMSRPWYRDFRGTLAYAPPEILTRNKYHQAGPIEVWSLGLLLGFLLTGRNPFPTQDDAIRGTMVLHNCRVATPDEEKAATIRRPSSRTRNQVTISSTCYDLLTRCLDPNPMTRATIAEVKAHPWLFPEYSR